MPAAVDKCVKALLSKWKDDPSSRPAPKKKGQDAKSQAFALCEASYQKSVAASLALMLEDGQGPTLIGAAATNRPFIPHLKPTEVIEEDGEKLLLVHLANSGHFSHPSGPFTLNRAVFSLMIANHQGNVLGQDAAYDCRHRPDDGAYGWFQRLYLGDEIGKGDKEFWGLVRPTPVGLEKIEGGEYRYSSMEFHRNFARDDVVLDLENSGEDFCLVDLELEANEEEPEEDMADEKKDQVTLEQLQAAEEKAKKLQKQQERDQKVILEQKRQLEAAQKEALRLQMAAIDTQVAAVVELATSHRDKDGNALPRPLIEWVSTFLKFEDIGEGDGVVRLEEGTEVAGEVRSYCIGAVKSLLLSMPGVVPAERRSHSGQDDQDGDKDDFDYGSLWKDEREAE